MAAGTAGRGCRALSPAPCAQCSTWCASARRVWQPGKRQCPSRAASARRSAGEMVRVRRPTLSTSPAGPWCIVTVAASHARRRAVSAETWMLPASSSTDWPLAGSGHAAGLRRRRPRGRLQGRRGGRSRTRSRRRRPVRAACRGAGGFILGSGRRHRAPPQRSRGNLRRVRHAPLDPGRVRSNPAPVGREGAVACSIVVWNALVRPAVVHPATLGQRVGVHMHDHLIAVARRALVQPAGQCALGHHAQCIRPPLRDGGNHRLRRVPGRAVRRRSARLSLAAAPPVRPRSGPPRRGPPPAPAAPRRPPPASAARGPPPCRRRPPRYRAPATRAAAAPRPAQPRGPPAAMCGPPARRAPRCRPGPRRAAPARSRAWPRG